MSSATSPPLLHLLSTDTDRGNSPNPALAALAEVVAGDGPDTGRGNSPNPALAALAEVVAGDGPDTGRGNTPNPARAMTRNADQSSTATTEATAAVSMA